MWNLDLEKTKDMNRKERLFGGDQWEGDKDCREEYY
jgi:hypothetical protein